MRVLVTGAVLDPAWKGGEPLVANFVVDGLKKRNFEVLVHSNVRSLKDRIGDFLSWKDVNAMAYKQYRSILRVYKPDVVLSFYDYDCSICMACLKESVPLFVSVNIWWPICPTLALYVNGQGPCKGPEALHCIRHMRTSRIPLLRLFASTFLYAKFLKRIDLLNTARRVIVPSYYVKNKLSLFGVKNLSVIYYGIDVDDIKPVEWQNSDVKVVINPTGYADERKGFNHFLALAKKLKAEFDGGVSFIAAGYRGKDVVEGTGWLPREKLIELLQSSYLVVIPPLWEEPFGIVALEAMAAGKPVVAYDSGGLSEIIVDGVTGLLVSRGNLKGLISAVEYLLKNEDEAKRMGREGRKRVEHFFNLNRMVDQYARELQKV
jgi:glycosyltransferase involved in cell wall biosynthesis